MREPVWSRLPDGLLDTVANWIDDGSDATVRVSARDVESAVTLTGEGSIERMVSVGPGRLVGVLCEPAGCIRRAAAPTLLITNTAANPHVADGRFAVRLARSLAASGISSLRIDSSGIGDSGPRARDDQSDIPYSDQVIVDIASAADWLKEQGHREIVAFGICSGAYASLHAASRERFAGVIAVNLPVFIWPRGETLANVVNNQTNSMRGYWASLRSRHKLRRLLLEGRDLRPVLRAVFRLVAGVMTVPSSVSASISAGGRVTRRLVDCCMTCRPAASVPISSTARSIRASTRSFGISAPHPVRSRIGRTYPSTCGTRSTIRCTATPLRSMSSPVAPSCLPAGTRRPNSRYPRNRNTRLHDVRADVACRRDRAATAASLASVSGTWLRSVGRGWFCQSLPLT